MQLVPNWLIEVSPLFGTPPLSDESLIKSIQVKGGNEQAWHQLLERYWEQISRWIRAKIHNCDSETLEDIQANIWESVAQAIAKQTVWQDNHFGPWLNRVTHNHINNYFRASKRCKDSTESLSFEELLIECRSEVLQRASTTVRSAESIYLDKITVENIRQAVAMLKNVEYQQVMRLHLFSVKNKEIALLMNKTEGWVATAISRSKKELLPILQRLECK